MSKTQEAIEQIKNGDWEEQNPESFNKSLSNSNHPLMLTQYSHDELSDMKLFKVKGKNIGFALKKKDGGYKEIVAVHNNEPGVSGIGDHLIQSAVKNGGVYGDHFDGHLTDLYRRNGFYTYKKDSFDPQYDEGGKFEAKYGRKDVHYVIHKSAFSEEQNKLLGAISQLGKV